MWILAIQKAWRLRLYLLLQLWICPPQKTPLPATALSKVVTVTAAPPGIAPTAALSVVAPAAVEPADDAPVTVALVAAPTASSSALLPPV